MIKLELALDDKNRPKLTWNNELNKNLSYKVYRRRVARTSGDMIEDEGFKIISSFNIDDDKNLGKVIKVLHVYDHLDEEIEFTNFLNNKEIIDKGMVIYKWVNESAIDSKFGFGFGKVEVISVSFEDFISDPNSYLYDSLMYPLHDVLCLGFNIEKYSIELDSNTIGSIEDYIKDGNGIITTRDFISGLVGSRNQLGSLRSYFNIRVGIWHESNYQADLEIGVGYEADKLYIHKSSEICLSPWVIGSVGDVLDIKETQTSSQFAYGDVWLKFYAPKVTPLGNLTGFFLDKGNFYVTAHNNCAMIMINQSDEILDVEKKILVNTIFHVNQKTTYTELVDTTGVDNAPPMKPSINDYYIDALNSKLGFKLSSSDTGVLFEYYVEGVEHLSGEVLRSNVVLGKSESFVRDFYFSLNRSIDVFDNVFEKSDSEVVQFTDIPNGNYIFRSYCDDYSNNKSRIDEFIVYVPTHEEYSKRNERNIPNMQRVNNRLRGPQESQKAHGFYQMANKNLKDLRDAIDKLEDSYKNLEQVDKTSNVIFSNVKNEIKSQIKELKSEKYLTDFK